MDNFASGSLVSARGRDWIVLKKTRDGCLIKPLGGMEEEVIEISPKLEQITSSSFPLPNPKFVGDAANSRLLREAVRLGLRSTTGPFRSFGHISVEPRPYQLVPLLMAMKQDVVRLLIADAVGIGKTVEALLVARELMDRGEIERMTVLCPPVLAEQWQRELDEKFHIKAELVLPSTIHRLEKGLAIGSSLFEKYPCTVVSLDFIKSARCRPDFLRFCPEFVIVDEAHSCASASGGTGSRRMQRYTLVQELAKDPERHMVFVTATPHSGNEADFHTLLGFLHPDFAAMPEDSLKDDGGSAASEDGNGAKAGAQDGKKDDAKDDAKKARRKLRERLAQCFVQRRRADITKYLNEATPIPERKTEEQTWQADEDWKKLFHGCLSLARRNIDASRKNGTEWQKMISWWSALALLRAVSSSPAATCATLSARAGGLEDNEMLPDDVAKTMAEDLFDAEASEDGQASDIVQGADTRTEEERKSDAEKDDAEGDEEDDAQDDVQDDAAGTCNSLPGTEDASGQPLSYAQLKKLAKSLEGEKDSKLQQLIPHVKKLLQDGFSPIIFCRYIKTAEYVCRELAKSFAKSGTLKECVTACVTSELVPQAREDAIKELARHEKRLLVATDCLSEGINLQQHFDAVIHYDLAWNPTRHEQREGRVDRFGQPAREVRILTWWGRDNAMDAMILDVLIRKYTAIRKELGVAVPVPGGADNMMETLVKSLLLRGGKTAEEKPAKPAADKSMCLPGVEQAARPVKKTAEDKKKEELSRRWEEMAAEQKKTLKTRFSQEAVKVQDVAAALADMRDALGSDASLASFMTEAAYLLGGTAQSHKGRKEEDCRTSYTFHFEAHERSLHPGLTFPDNSKSYVFSLPAGPSQVYLSRTSPLVEGLASYLAQSALDEDASDSSCDAPLLPRCGVMEAKEAPWMRTMLLLRLRYALKATGAVSHESLAEECIPLVFDKSPSQPLWQDDLPREELEKLFSAAPCGNLGAAYKQKMAAKVVDAMPDLMPHIVDFHKARAARLEEQHKSVRDASRRANRRYSNKVAPLGSPDILGLFIYIPSL